MATHTSVYIFDIDGVITEPQTKKFTNDKLIKLIIQLSSQNIIAFNTGRSSEWIQNQVLSKLPNLNQNNFFCSCEMGNVSLYYSPSGKVLESTHNNNLIPEQLSGTIIDLVASSYYESMFVDKTKKVILTIEMKDGYPLAAYEKLRDRLSGEIRIILKHYHPNIHIRPSSSTIAIDVKSIESNKKLGAHAIHNWIKTKIVGYQNLPYICLGDSSTDTDMSDYFYSVGFNTKFVFVGTESINTDKKYPIIRTAKPFTKGTEEFLSTINDTILGLQT